MATTTPRVPGAPVAKPAADKADTTGFGGTTVVNDGKGATTVTSDTSPALAAIRSAEAAGIAAIDEANRSAGVTPLKVTMPLKGSVEEQVASLKAQVEELNRHNVELTSATKAMLAQLQKAEVGVVQLEVVKELPTLKEAMADCEKRIARGESIHAVMTKEGNYVHPLAGYQAPPGMAMDPKAMAAMAQAMANAMSSAASFEASKTKRVEETMEAGKAPKDD